MTLFYQMYQMIFLMFLNIQINTHENVYDFSFIYYPLLLNNLFFIYRKRISTWLEYIYKYQSLIFTNILADNI